jgi:hypothetical protein
MALTLVFQKKKIKTISFEISVGVCCLRTDYKLVERGMTVGLCLMGVHSTVADTRSFGFSGQQNEEWSRSSSNLLGNLGHRKVAEH